MSPLPSLGRPRLRPGGHLSRSPPKRHRPFGRVLRFRTSGNDSPVATPAVGASSQVSEWSRILAMGASHAVMYTKSNTNVTASPKGGAELVANNFPGGRPFTTGDSLDLANLANLYRDGLTPSRLVEGILARIDARGDD